jgi:hypothetical protein
MHLALVAGSDYFFRFAYWESWGDIRVSKNHSVPIIIGFSPIPNQHHSLILGGGWTFALLDSRMFPTGRTTYELRYPNGEGEIFRKTKKNNQLSAGGWLAEIKGDVITAKSSCGWTLTTNTGRLQHFRTPDGVLVEFQLDERGTHRILAGGKPVLTLRPDRDRQTAEKTYHLNLPDQKKHGIIKLVTKDQIEVLSSFQWDGEVEKKYDLKTGELTVTGMKHPSKRFFQWDTNNGFLKKDGDWEYSFVTISGIRCGRIHYPDGTFLIHGSSADKSIIIEKSNTSSNIWKKEVFGGYGILHGKTKNRYLIEADGRETLVEKCLYNEHGMLVRHLDEGKWYIRSADKEERKDAVTGALVWMKKKDAKGRVIEYFSGSQTYLFNYREKDVEITVLEKDKSLRKKVTASYKDFAKIFPITNNFSLN